ncbi:hypothetical protein NEOLEDRAFT_353778 [Neolentinus lepideus HHB14362 ss-1]|uniref:Uncharacterized protein n=1 Tax=Neolentinus lepideus HHB14362 ss-1 TaxID=1314782 RepID=A0A165SK67_9AGAM|nr:hypothetical protein NEOLEDRAFT_353778 [Neolentinus lepideus HHB14362 ss-1]
MREFQLSTSRKRHKSDNAPPVISKEKSDRRRGKRLPPPWSAVHPSIEPTRSFAYATVMPRIWASSHAELLEVFPSLSTATNDIWWDETSVPTRPVVVLRGRPWKDDGYVGEKQWKVSFVRDHYRPPPSIPPALSDLEAQPTVSGTQLSPSSPMSPPGTLLTIPPRCLPIPIDQEAESLQSLPNEIPSRQSNRLLHKDMSSSNEEPGALPSPEPPSGSVQDDFPLGNHALDKGSSQEDQPPPPTPHSREEYNHSVLSGRSFSPSNFHPLPGFGESVKRRADLSGPDHVDNLAIPQPGLALPTPPATASNSLKADSLGKEAVRTAGALPTPAVTPTKALAKTPDTLSAPAQEGIPDNLIAMPNVEEPALVIPTGEDLECPPDICALIDAMRNGVATVFFAEREWLGLAPESKWGCALLGYFAGAEISVSCVSSSGVDVLSVLVR